MKSAGKYESPVVCNVYSTVSTHNTMEANWKVLTQCILQTGGAKVIYVHKGKNWQAFDFLVEQSQNDCQEVFCPLHFP